MSESILDALTIDDHAPFDQFYGNGKQLTELLAGLKPSMQVLDVGGGLGWPARTLAIEFGCIESVIDLTAEIAAHIIL